MENFHNLLRAVLDGGVDQFNTRTGRRIRIIDSNRKQEEIWRDVERVTIQELVD